MVSGVQYCVWCETRFLSRSCLLYVDDICGLCKPGCNLFVILYADDILLLSPTVTALEKLLHACERELNWLDMVIYLFIYLFNSDHKDP